jgi:hypothetical protein
MSRFEMTISDGEKILVDHPAEGMSELLSELQSSDFLLFKEIRGSTSNVAKDVIVASAQITIIRAIDGDSRQSTTFRPKR